MHSLFYSDNQKIVEKEDDFEKFNNYETQQVCSVNRPISQKKFNLISV